MLKLNQFFWFSLFYLFNFFQFPGSFFLLGGEKLAELYGGLTLLVQKEVFFDNNGSLKILSFCMEKWI